jgi:hypothetical protein
MYICKYTYELQCTTTRKPCSSYLRRRPCYGATACHRCLPNTAQSISAKGVLEIHREGEDTLQTPYPSISRSRNIPNLLESRRPSCGLAFCSAAAAVACARFETVWKWCGTGRPACSVHAAAPRRNRACHKDEIRWKKGLRRFVGHFQPWARSTDGALRRRGTTTTWYSMNCHVAVFRR